VPASRCAYNHLAKRKRRYHHLIGLQRYTGRLCEERNNFVGRLLRDSVESLNTWREGRAYVRGRWEEVRPHHDQYRHEAPINLLAPKFHRPDTNTQRLTLAFGSMPSLSSGNRIPVEDATTRVPLIIDRSKSQTGAADFNSYITRQLQGTGPARAARRVSSPVNGELGFAGDRPLRLRNLWSAPQSFAHCEELRVTSARYSAGLRMPSDLATNGLRPRRS